MCAMTKRQRADYEALQARLADLQRPKAHKVDVGNHFSQIARHARELLEADLDPESLVERFQQIVGVIAGDLNQLRQEEERALRSTCYQLERLRAPRRGPGRPSPRRAAESS